MWFGADGGVLVTQAQGGIRLAFEHTAASCDRHILAPLVSSTELPDRTVVGLTGRVLHVGAALTF